MKSYPRSQFEVVNRTSISEIPTSAASGVIPVMLAPYTSDKGSEEWELLYGFDNFTTHKGGLSFSKHGQAQLLVANMLSKGSYVLAKRMVSEDATIANIGIKARVIKSNNVSYVYFYTVSASGAKTLEDVAHVCYGDFDPATEPTVNEDDGYTSIDIPLMAFTALGRGASALFIRLVPEYYASKNSTYMKYTLEVMENTELLEKVLCTVNPDAVIDGVSQSIQSRVSAISNQVKCTVFEDGILKLVTALTETATINGVAVTKGDLVNMDFINALDKKGTSAISGIITDDQSSGSSLWTSFKPVDLPVCDLQSMVGIPLVGGTYGTMGTAPVTNKAEYEKMLLGVFGKNTSSTLFDPVIYDLDNYKIDAIFDCNFPVTVKNAITDLVDFRGDCVFIADLGMECRTIDTIVQAASELTPSKYQAIYHNYFKVIDPYTKKQIQVTMPYLLAPRLIDHISKGVGRPFAGIANEIYFPEIIEGSINLVPIVIPGLDQKQALVDANINYISLYDGTPVMETMYTNDDEYSQLSYLHNVMAVQEIIKLIRTRCPRTRYTFLDGTDLESYIDDTKSIINEFTTNFKSIEMMYMADDKYESNNIFYAVIKVRFKNFVQEEYFKVIAIS